ncbi:TetR family transcriptional regulator [Gordonia sp. CNJ-863]|jgi:AcrR family transcriptional regulator|nr:MULTISPECIES: TetR/AcrR family transcriptional regulator [Gordonia]MDH3020602.1 TetR/AcrR family transcriptional regulator [Gordonia alkanivorans]MDH3049329.1 TetR/AcrR family transcriptional regulator [Gordonia alkanivorans]MDJ0007368.1 TetR/AcrR family transcriptional regulator [Gordonia alkanivorans]MDJ0027625.1 TetR/AcrR family transcriptional regulator [Gordonia alkanivorans]MDJ0099834.1 TetR/AcrR family transcriptional regulator [Gordonia alkanivorans]
MASERSTYHHGNLRNALIDEAWELARTSAPEKVTVREAARRAGVSHNAAYRHFADRQELMTSIADRALATLADLMRERIATVPDDQAPGEVARSRFRETARAYALFAIDEPHLFQVAFHAEFSRPGVNPDVSARRDGPYAILHSVLDEMVAAGEIPPERRPDSEIVCWAAVHGFAELCIKGPLGLLPEAERENYFERLIGTILHGLKAPLG